jgi:acetoin utilization deacetylase AcuC-like enzyme
MRLYVSPRVIEHTPPPGHPERPERAEVFARVAVAAGESGVDVREPEPASREALERVHAADYVDRIAATAGRAAMLDPDTYTSPLRAGEADRVAIVDIDVHHGNGTQAIFYDDPSVLYVSSHQFPYYPGTGAAGETGDGSGVGATLNLPMGAGTTDAGFLEAYETTVVPALERFRPDAILVSAGFDGHELDPLGGWRLSTEGYRTVMVMLDEAAARLCGRRIAVVTEGGYHLEALSDCLTATIDVLK